MLLGSTASGTYQPQWVTLDLVPLLKYLLSDLGLFSTFILDLSDGIKKVHFSLWLGRVTVSQK